MKYNESTAKHNGNTTNTQETQWKYNGDATIMQWKCNEKQWKAMKHIIHGSQWIALENNEKQTITMKNNERPWKSMKADGNQWKAM